MRDDSTRRADTRTRANTDVNRWWRAGAGLIALAFLALGAWSVFATKVEAGPVALIAAGVLFGFVAIGGRLPSRVKVGDTEIDLRRAASALRDDAAETTPDEVPEALRRLNRVAEAAPGIAEPALVEIAYQQLVISILIRTAAAVGGIM